MNLHYKEHTYVTVIGKALSELISSVWPEIYDNASEQS